MCLFEYDKKQHMKAEREEAKEEGRIEGKIEGKIDAILDLAHEGVIDKKLVAEKLGVTIEEVEKKLKEKYK